MLVGLVDDEAGVVSAEEVELEIRVMVVLYANVKAEDISPLESALGAGLLKGRPAIVMLVSVR